MRRRLRLNGARMISLMHIMDAVSHRALQQGAQWASVCLGIEGMHWGIGYATRYWVCISVCKGVGFLRVSIVESAPCHCFSYRLSWQEGSASGRMGRAGVVMYLNTNLDLRKYEDEEDPNHGVGVNNGKLNIFEESIVAGEIPPRPPPPQYI